MSSAAAPSADLELRPARLSECGEIAALAAEVLAETWSAPQISSELALPEGRVWLARERGRLAGFLIARRELDELHLLLLGVAPAAQRRGLGRRLLRAVLAADPGLARAHLEVRESNAGARGFYAAEAFVEVGRRPRHYPGGEAAILMSRGLSPRG